MREINRSKGSTNTERALARLCDQTFLELWSYPSLYTSEGRKSGKGVGKELCDLLVVFGSDIVIFSDKDIKFNTDIDLSIAWSRWKRKSVDESIVQLHGARKWLIEHRKEVYFDPQCQEHFPFLDESTNYRIYLIAVTTSTQIAAASHFGHGSTGSFMLCSIDGFPTDEHPFIVVDNRARSYVHVLDEITLKLLLSELDTAPDLIKYLSAKEDAIRRGRIRMIPGEEELLAVYMKNGGPFVDQPFIELEKAAPPNIDVIQIAEGEWAQYVNTGMRTRLKELNAGSYFWDELIKRFTTAILTATAPNPLDASVNMHEIAARMLASESRIRRGQLAREYQKKINNTPQGIRTSITFSSLTNPQACIILVIAPRDPNEDGEEYRNNRRNLLHAYGLVAKLKMPDLSIFTLIGTEPGDSELRSEDVLVLKIEVLTQDDRDQAEILIREHRILSEVRLIERHENGIANVYAPHATRFGRRSSKPVVGRNSPCPCGSGKKHKRCCLARTI